MFDQLFASISEQSSAYLASYTQSEIANLNAPPPAQGVMVLPPAMTTPTNLGGVSFTPLHALGAAAVLFLILRLVK